MDSSYTNIFNLEKSQFVRGKCHYKKMIINAALHWLHSFLSVFTWLQSQCSSLTSSHYISVSTQHVLGLEEAYSNIETLKSAKR